MVGASAASTKCCRRPLGKKSPENLDRGSAVEFVAVEFVTLDARVESACRAALRTLRPANVTLPSTLHSHHTLLIRDRENVHLLSSKFYSASLINYGSTHPASVARNRAMDPLLEEAGRVEAQGNFNRTLENVQKAVDLLKQAKEDISNSTDPMDMHIPPAHTSLESSRRAVLATKLKSSAKTSSDDFEKSLKDVFSANKAYSKAFEKAFSLSEKFEWTDFLTEFQKFNVKLLDITNNKALRKQLHLINRAIAMHLLREGQFGVASTFMREGKEGRPVTSTTHGFDILSLPPTQITLPPGLELTRSEALQSQFQEMYHILHELRANRNLTPAVDWAGANSNVLESRGSNLYFDLCRLQFVQYFSGDESASESPNPADGPLRALSYARDVFAPFQRRYAAEISQLTGAMAFWENLADSPYRRVFQNSSAWDEVATSFTKEFCSLLGLSADSPLYVAATAGAIALPLLAKARVLMKINKTDWTTAEEMPVCWLPFYLFMFAD